MFQTQSDNTHFNMIFRPTIDISKYIDQEGVFTRDGSEQMRRDTEDDFVRYDEQKENDRVLHDKVVVQINQILSYGTVEGYEELGRIINSKEYTKLAGIYYDLESFRTSYAIYRAEMSTGIILTVYDNTQSIEEYNSLKLLTMYLFRRIQLGFPLEETESLFEIIVDRNMSFFYIICLLKELIVGDKRKIGFCLSVFFRDRGYFKESEIIREYIDKNYPKIQQVLYSSGATGYCYDISGNAQIGQSNVESISKKRNICFITCTNNDLMYSECLYYISKLEIPEGYEINAISVTEAENMASGYNEAMESSAADIFVFLHQDVCILNPFFLQEIVSIFDSDSDIGMIGMVGSPVLPPDAVMWHGNRIGSMYALEPDELRYSIPDYGHPSALFDVEAVDGLLIVTNRKIKWREDLFDGWDFYDVSQSAEYRNNGYRVVVPEQTSPWTAHDDGIMNLYDYNRYRHRYLEEYD